MTLADCIMIIVVSLHLFYQAKVGYQKLSADEWNAECEKGTTQISVLSVILMTWALFDAGGRGRNINKLAKLMSGTKV